MKQLEIRTYALLLLLPLLAACESQAPVSPPDGQRQEMRFNYFLQEGENLIPLNSIQSRGGDNDLSQDVYLYGWWNTVDVPTEIGVTSPEDGSRRFFDKTLIVANGSYSGERRYWVADGKTRHSFCAYSGPEWNENINNGGFGVDRPLWAEVGNLTKNAFYPAINFHQHSDPAQQFDVLVGYGPTNVVVDGATPTVNIQLHHACARILLKLMVSGGVTLYDCDVSMTYQPKVSKGGNIYYQPKFHQAWASDPNRHFCVGTFPLSSNLIVPASASVEHLAVTVGELKMVSQTLPATWLEVVVAYRLAPAGAVKTVKALLPGNIMIDPEVQYTYYLTVMDQSESLTLSDIEIDPWVTEVKFVDPL